MDASNMSGKLYHRPAARKPTSGCTCVSSRTYILIFTCAMLPFYFVLYTNIDTHEDKYHVGGDKLSRQDLLHVRNQVYKRTHTEPQSEQRVVDWGRWRKMRKSKRRAESDDTGDMDVVDGNAQWFKRDTPRPARAATHVPPESDFLSFLLSARGHTPSPRHQGAARRLYVDAMGRYGNNLFQVASAWALARESGRELVLAPGLWGTLYPFINNTLAVEEPPHNLTRVTEARAGHYDPTIVTKLNVTYKDDDVMVCCYLQSWRYLSRQVEPLKALFTLSDTWREVGQQGMARAKARHILAIVNRTHTAHVRLPRNMTLVGIHVRMQDVAEEEARARGYGPAPLSYLSAAMDWYRKRHKHVLFVVVTDAVKWCRENFTRHHDDAVIASSPGGVDFFADFAVLLQCHHLVLTVGTFGWFAGWLSEGNVVYYSGWPVAGTEIGEQYSKGDYFPPHWVPLNG